MPTASIHSRIDSDRGAFREDWEQTATYRRYARGDQEDVLNAAQKQMLGSAFVELEHEQSDNICHLGLVETADRVRLEGIDVEGAEESATVAPPAELALTQKEINGLYIKNALADLQWEVNYNTPRDGNAAIFVDWKKTLNIPAKTGFLSRALRSLGLLSSPSVNYGRVVFKLEEWWDGESGVFITDPDGDEEHYAVKEWTELIEAYNPNSEKQTRRIVWYDNRIEQQVRASGIATGSGDEWREYLPTIPWTRTGEFGGPPLHVPLVHFANPSKRRGHCGISKLKGGILRAQDEINRGHSDLTIGMDLTAFSMLAASGGYPQVVEPYTDGAIEIVNPETLERMWIKVMTLNVGPGMVWQNPSPTFKVTPIPPGDLSQITNGITFKYKSAARNLRIPEYVIAGGDVPSGYALERAEQPAIGEAQAMIDRFTPAWATAFHRATEMLNTFGKMNLNEDALLLPRFADPKRPDKLYTISVERATLALDAEKAASEAGTYATVLTGEKTDPPSVPGSPTTQPQTDEKAD